ncbi:MAG: lytic transglycosylase domain-containing protein [Limisphaerales bacterium]
MRRKLLVLLLCAGVVGYWWWSYRREHRYDKFIVAASKKYKIDAALIKAICWRESRFHPEARGSAGELGLMQVRSTAAQEWASAENVQQFHHEACLNPATNILVGTWYLQHVLRRYRQTDNPVAYALADYNAGRGNVLKWLVGSASTNSTEFVSHIGFPTTQDYVQVVMQRRDSYRKEFPH